MAEFLRVAVTNEDTQIISAQGVKIVEQASTTTTTIAYGSGSTSADVITLTHTALDAGSELMRNAVQDALIKAFDQSYGNAPVIDIQLPTGIAVSGIAIA